MSEWTVSPEFEEQIRRSYGVPGIRPEFVASLEARLMQNSGGESLRPSRVWGLRPARAALMGLLVILILTTLLIGPQRVSAGIKKLLGYIPGIGFVDPEGSMRMLAEPVRQTRDGITVAVNLAFLLQDETRLEYGVSGVPLSAYPEREAVTGCDGRPYLRLWDGSRVEIDAPVPAGVHELTFVLPCIFNTLPGTAPVDWELLLIFVDAPEDLEILPVVEVSSSPSPGSIPGSATETASAFAEDHAVITVDQFIETEEGYILLGSVHSQVPEGSWLQVRGALVIHDAAGEKIHYTFPADTQPPADFNAGPGGIWWSAKIRGSGLTFPLKISLGGVVLTEIDLQEPGSLVFDTGMNSQPGQTWELNQVIEVGEYSVTLLSVTMLEDGYSFSIDPGPDLVNVGVSIEGFQALGAGGGGIWGGPFTTSMVFSELPSGELTLLLDNPIFASPAETWEVLWQPGEVQNFEPVVSQACLDAASYASIPALPNGLDGQVLVAQANPVIQLVTSGLDGSDVRVLAEGSVHGALSPDGSLLAYATEDGLRILDVETGAETQVAGSAGIGQHWSPDSRSIAVVRADEAYGIFLVSLDGAEPQQFSNLGYESIAGWLPDGNRLYYAVPGSSDQGFDLWQVNVNSGERQFLFVLKDSSLKAPFPALSPDGTRIAYRGRDNSSLYIASLDGSEPVLVLDAPALAISGIAWERSGHLLGVSLITEENQEGEVILLAPEGCEVYRLPGVEGSLVAVWAR